MVERRWNHNPPVSARIATIDDAIAEMLESFPVWQEDEDDDDEALFPSRSRPVVRAAVQDIGAPSSIDMDALHRPPPGFRRDRLGRWRYEVDNHYVPGASDVVFGALFRFPVDKDRVLVPVAAARVDDLLFWCTGFAMTVAGARPAFAVPSDMWAEAAAVPVTLSAPELAAGRLVDTARLASMLGVRTRTVSSYLARGRLPEPVARIANSPVWTLPILLRWLAAGRPAALSRPGPAVRRGVAPARRRTG